MAALRNDFLHPIARLSASSGDPGSDLLRHLSPRRFASQRTRHPASQGAGYHRERKPRREYKAGRFFSFARTTRLTEKGRTMSRSRDWLLSPARLTRRRRCRRGSPPLSWPALRLLAWCVMPNHVHVLFSPLREHTLDAILHSWKSYSARKANALLGRTGPFWQREYFDHLVRDQSSLRRITQYIQDNPKRAGLLDWPWVEVLS